MISPDHAQLMARYNTWQNQSIYGAASSVPSAELHLDRGAFFGSIFAILSHIYWADQLWLERFSHAERTVGDMASSTCQASTFKDLQAKRTKFDAKIESWAGGLTQKVLAAEFSWVSGLAGAPLKRPFWVNVTHFFNHQTHHRGQVHAMLTALGASPQDTDLIFMRGL